MQYSLKIRKTVRYKISASGKQVPQIHKYHWFVYGGRPTYYILEVEKQIEKLIYIHSCNYSFEIFISLAMSQLTLSEIAQVRTFHSTDYVYSFI